MALVGVVSTGLLHQQLVTSTEAAPRPVRFLTDVDRLRDEYEDKHPQLIPARHVSDPQALRNPRPDQGETLIVYVAVPTIEDPSLQRPRMLGSAGQVMVVTT